MTLLRLTAFAMPETITSFKNEAAWQTAKNVPLQVGPAEVMLPGPDQILIKNQAWAINPVDWKMQQTGMFIESYPAIFGVDIAGEVAVVGRDVTKFKASAYHRMLPLRGCGMQGGQMLTVPRPATELQQSH